MNLPVILKYKIYTAEEVIKKAIKVNPINESLLHEYACRFTEFALNLGAPVPRSLSGADRELAVAE